VGKIRSGDLIEYPENIQLCHQPFDIRSSVLLDQVNGIVQIDRMPGAHHSVDHDSLPEEIE
jgi:hypothetical protein